MSIQGSITLNEICLLELDAVPTADGGIRAPIGSIASVQGTNSASMWLKTGSANTAWTAVVSSNSNDIPETQRAILANQSSPADITGFAFDSTVASFCASAYLELGSAKESMTLVGTNLGSSWSMSPIADGSATGITLSITSAGQVQYTNSSGTAGTIVFSASMLSKPTGLPTIAANQVTPVDVTGFVFSSGIAAFTAQVTITLNSVSETLSLIGTNHGDTWTMSSLVDGGSTGVILSITSSGQIQYTNDSAYSGTITFSSSTLNKPT